MKVAIIGIPKSGKTTIFNALTKGKAEVAAYSSTLAPNTGVVGGVVIHSRFSTLRAMKLKRFIQTTTLL